MRSESMKARKSLKEISEAIILAEKLQIGSWQERIRYFKIADKSRNGAKRQWCLLTPIKSGEEDFFDTLKKAHGALGKVKKKIMVTHIQPSDSILGLNNFGWGSTGVRKAIEEFKPDFHLCGHVHETEGIEEIMGKTKVINVGKSGKIIEL